VWRERGGKGQLKKKKIFLNKTKTRAVEGTRLKYVLNTYMLIYLVNNYFSGLGRGRGRGGGGGGGKILGKAKLKVQVRPPKVYPLINHYYYFKYIILK
jgi:hypothetical protein